MTSRLYRRRRFYRSLQRNWWKAIPLVGLGMVAAQFLRWSLT